MCHWPRRVFFINRLALDLGTIDDATTVLRVPESLAECAFHPITLAPTGGLVLGAQLVPNPLGDVLAATEVTFLEPDIARAVDALEGLGIDGRQLGTGPGGQMLAETTA